MINFIGLKDFTQLEKNTIEEFSNKHFKKLRIKGNLIVQCKKHDLGGRVKYSFHVRVESPDIILNAKASSWELEKCLHGLFNKLLREEEHKFKK